jgi:hypothetical protein
MCKRFMDVAGDGECEIRQIYTAPADAVLSAQSTESSARTA